MTGGHQDHDLVDVGRRLQRADRVLDDRLAGHLDQLLGDGQADARARASGEDDRHVPQSSHRSTVSARAA
jgi:hypothetical protein